MTNLRIGQGYDVHRLTEGRRLILGGVDIPYEKGLDGHSDADVLVHAVMDALLGAAKGGDIGKLFPDTDPRYKGISSLELLRHVAKVLNEKYGAGTVELEIREQYRNMLEKIQPCYHIVENACAAIEEAGLKPIIEPIRGGTDGARLSFMGLPCPNLGTGAYAGHGPYEHATAEGMEKCVEILVNIVKRYAKA